MSEINLDFPDRFVTSRMVIRRLQPGDGPKLFEAIEASREHLKATMEWAHKPQTLEEVEIHARTNYANWALRTDLGLVIFDPSESRVLGRTGLHRMDWNVGSFEIGYWIRPDEEGKGYVTETVRELCRFAFEDLKANRVHIRCAAWNDRSAAVPRRAGFVEEGRLLNAGKDPYGVLHDVLVFGITPELWRKTLG